MQETNYNKLVRDKIPSIILADGRKPKTKKIESDEELKILLADKLIEESHEYLNNKKIEELADIMEIILTILKIENIDLSDFERMRLEKKRDRGGFDEQIYLISVLD
ncbi:MAG: nucleoside triphosphate pyrophosphohydrolase [Candidatus Heimdallarchaeota archaeon]